MPITPPNEIFVVLKQNQKDIVRMKIGMLIINGQTFVNLSFVIVWIPISSVLHSFKNERD